MWPPFRGEFAREVHVSVSALLLSTIYPPHLSTMGDVIPQFSGVKVVIRFTLKLVTDEDHVTVIGDVVWKSSAIFRVAYTVIQGLNVPA